MIPNPIQKVLSTTAARQVRALLMGGQACVLYGAAEFSRDTDLLVLADSENLSRLKGALDDLQARCIAVPPFEAQYLERGHAVHFRCEHTEASGTRVDVMARLRGGADFPVLWERRTSISDSDNTQFELLSLPDLVQAKKTQRSKDWPMLRRLLEGNYLRHRETAERDQQQFWLRELRTPELLNEAAQAWPELAREVVTERPLLALAQTGKRRELEQALAREEEEEKQRDRLYWAPLKAELEKLRHAAVRRK